MTDSTTRPPRMIDGGIIARWITVALLCAVVLAVGTRDRGTNNRTTVAELQATAIVEVSQHAPEPLEPIPPDFLEPLPIVEPSSVGELPKEPALVPPPPELELQPPSVEEMPELADPPSEPLPPVAETVSISPDPTTAEVVAPIAEVTELAPTAEVTPVEPIEYDEDAELAAQLTPQDLLTFSPSVAEISHKMLPEVRAAFELTQHGATHAAHAKFVRILRRIAQAKDVEAMTERHVRSLDEGLRSLDEADDFMPEGGITPALDLASIAATHQTPMLKIHQSRYTLPHEVVALYHRYAQQKLGAAVAGEQAGSMALHGLGKIHGRWAETENESLAATRQSMTMYRAALVAHPRNHLAANELGVLLARSGRYDHAATALDWAAQLAGTATIYYNLAKVQQQRGQMALAAAAQAQADRLAMLERSSGEVSRRHGIEWVAPQDMARVSDAHQSTPQPVSTATATRPAQAAPPRQSTIVPAPRGGTWR
ncbi:MAG: hypothetical protein WD851_09100 [Pirellulales bacterium]